jgi:hypothetical protein
VSAVIHSQKVSGSEICEYGLIRSVHCIRQKAKGIPAQLRAVALDISDRTLAAVIALRYGLVDLSEI